MVIMAGTTGTAAQHSWTFSFVYLAIVMNTDKKCSIKRYIMVHIYDHLDQRVVVGSKWVKTILDRPHHTFFTYGTSLVQL